MAFIRVQKLVRDGDGNILSGSAAIKESRYVKDGGKFHSRQIVRERLGKVVWLARDGKSGIFLSLLGAALCLTIPSRTALTK